MVFSILEMLEQVVDMITLPICEVLQSFNLVLQVFLLLCVRQVLLAYRLQIAFYVTLHTSTSSCSLTSDTTVDYPWVRSSTAMTSKSSNFKPSNIAECIPASN